MNTIHTLNISCISLSTFNSSYKIFTLASMEGNRIKYRSRLK